MRKKILAIAAILGIFSFIVYISFRPFQDKRAISKKVVSELIKDTALPSNGYQAEGEDEEERDNPRAAADDRFEMTKDDALGYPPSERKLEAYQQIQEWQRGQSQRRSAIPNVEWVERGPTNVGGRTRALMFDPNDPTSKKVWAGAVGGGLWYSNDITDPALRWRQEDDIMTNLAVSTLSYDPSNTQVFYMGTGLGYTSDIRGLGIWKSSDGGGSWSQLSSTNNSDFNFVQKIEVTSSGIVLASTLNGLMRSTDGGNSWQRVVSGRMGDIEIATNGVIYASSGVNSVGEIFRSSNEGITWEDISPNETAARIELAISPSNPSVVYAVSQSIENSGTRNDVAYFKKSTNGGNTWADITIPLYVNPSGESRCELSTDHFTRGQAFFDLILSVHPEDEDIVFAGGINLSKTTDGGQSWETVTDWSGGGCDEFVHADQHEIVVRPNFPNEIIIGNDGGVYYSNDAGSSNNPNFDARNLGYNTVLFYSVAMANELNSNVFFAGAQDNGTQVFSAAGINQTTELFGGDGVFCFVDQDDPNIVIVSVPNNNYFLSLDGGKSIVLALIDDDDRGRFLNRAAYDSENNTLYSGADADELYRVTNVSATPDTTRLLNLNLSGGEVTAIAVSPHTANTIFVGTTSNTSRVFRIDNANDVSPTVTNITNSFDAGRGSFISSLAVGATDDQLLVTFSNFGAISVFETKDGGTNWVNKEDNLPDMPVNWGLYNPKNYDQVLLATELGVWSTNNMSAANPNWEPTNSGLATVRTDMLQYRSSDETVIAATYGRGLFTTNVFATTIDADFKTEQVVSYVGVPVTFEDASLLPNSSWAWTFGDGTTSNLQNPSKTYSTPGTYDVSLTIDNGNNVETKAAYVTILPTKNLPFTLADGGDFESNASDFTSRALLNNINLWELGNPSNRLSTVSSGANAWKTDLDGDITDIGAAYSSALYTPAFDFSNVNRDYTIKFKKSIETSFCNAPYGLQLQYSIDGGANWSRLGSAQPAFGSVNWYNRSDGVGCAIVTSIFPDGEGWNAVVLTGDNEVDLSVDNENTELKLNFLAGQPNVSFRFVAGVATGFTTYNRDGFMIDDFEITAVAPEANFIATNTVSYSGAPIQFSFLSAGATSYLWNFGDGNTSTEENPIHTYQTSGQFDVTLTINGTTSVTRTGYISILPDSSVPYELSDGGDFESNTTDFAVQNVTGTGFELGSSSVSGKNGTASGSNAWVTGLTSATYQDGSAAALHTPSFSFITLGEYTLEFKANFSFEPTWDGLIVQYTTDRGRTWIKLNDNLESGWYNQTSNEESIFGVSVPIFSGTTSGAFETFSTDVSFLGQSESVAFRFVFLTDGSVVDAGLAIDDFRLEGPTAGPGVPNFEFTGNSGCSGQQVVFTNTSTGTITDLAWNFGANATPATATGQGPHSVAYSGNGNSTVSLTVTSPINGETVEQKSNIISTVANFIATFTSEEDLGNRTTVLTASEGDSYQWFTTEGPIEGATSQQFIADETGVYSVAITRGTCTRTSSIAQIITSSEEDKAFEKNVSVFPNPTKGVFKINVSDPVIGKLTLNIFDNLGNRVISKSVSKSSFEEEYELNITQAQAGVYLVEIVSEKAKTVKRIIKR